jgi:uncharacterized protein (UPF0548 family)
MFLFSKPNPEAIHSFLSTQASANFSYSDVGASRERAPNGYVVDHNRVQLGRGAEAFQCAARALARWKMFDFPWIQLCRPDAPIEAGATVALLVSHFGFWSLNACRVVYVIEEHGAVDKFGFAYGTLEDHAERGEERFTVEWNAADDSVWYDLYAFSRPGPLARLAYPYARRLQKRFAQDSMAAMKAAMSDLKQIERG